MTVVQIPSPERPFDLSGIERGADGILRYVDLPDSLIAVLQERVEMHPDREAIKEVDGSSLSYRELWDRSAAVAGGLVARGVRHGDRVALRLPASNEWVVSFFGIILAGAVVVAVNTRLTEPEVDYIVEDSGAVLSIATAEDIPQGDTYPAVDLGHGDIAALFYTSGTTGRPKGAVMTHENFLSNIENLVRSTPLSRELGSDFRTLISVPLFHVTGCNSQLLSTIFLGGTAVILPTLNIPTLLRVIPQERISWLVSAPAIYQLAISHADFPATDISSVQWLGYGGAPITSALVQRIANGFPHARLSNGYGCTETSSVTTVLPDGLTAWHPDSVGLPVPVAELALDIRESDSLTGELLVRAPNVIAGYWNKPAETSAAFEGSWFRTGDVVRIDQDGLVYILDRLKDLVNRGGENVYCVEVENALAQIPGVVESAVCGVPDSLMGEKVGAIVVVNEPLTPQEIVEGLTGRLADYKIPEYVVIQDSSLPRTAAGKIRKADINHPDIWGDPLRRKNARASSTSK